MQTIRTGIPAESADIPNGRKQRKRKMTKKKPAKDQKRTARKPAQKSKANIISYSTTLLLIALLIWWPLIPQLASLSNASTVVPTALFSLLLTFSALSYLYFRGFDSKGIISAFGLNKPNINRQNLLYAFLLFLIIFTMEIGISISESVFNIAIKTNSSLVLAGVPAFFLLFVGIIAPINEEIFFRGLLVPRIGIVISALIFASLHSAYNSTFGIEMIAAFIFAVAAGYIFKKTGSIYPTILAHILVNMLAVIIFL